MYRIYIDYTLNLYRLYIDFVYNTYLNILIKYRNYMDRVWIEYG